VAIRPVSDASRPADHNRPNISTLCIAFLAFADIPLTPPRPFRSGSPLGGACNDDTPDTPSFLQNHDYRLHVAVSSETRRRYARRS